MPRITVRTFRPQDAEQASRILIAAFKTFLKGKYPKALNRHFSAASLAQGSLRKDAHSESIAFVAVDGARVVGYLKVGAQDSGLGSLDYVGIDPEYFGHRIGDRLMQPADRFWRRWKQRKISTCVSSHNRKALLYYIRNGFVPEGFRPDHFIDGVHEIPLGRFL
ncbi:MAG: hypothetical protein A3K19_08030 [Lentisphaerae bacterium RIFOXYB12_FULL_65_16]|nr:MAG: hypothetical protein A3K18_23800 [Lentisphaerae bacterium RIFOXYA12_64_32]OGV91187.1 MAG: hypothetical protein A3K19_08030 [Lentisphaerae bacterium RIFOXYB12_FULL_65_16]